MVYLTGILTSIVLGVFGATTGTSPPPDQPVVVGGPPTSCPRGSPVAFNALTLVGMNEHAAAALARRYGCYTRVIQRDGHHFAVTGDLVPSRIDLTVTGGSVASVSVG